MENKAADFQEFCAKKNVWMGRAVVLLVVPIRSVITLLTPIAATAERVVRAALNVLGTLVRMATFGRFAHGYTLTKAVIHIKQAVKAATLGVFLYAIKALFGGLRNLVVGLCNPENTCRKKTVQED